MNYRPIKTCIIFLILILNTYTKTNAQDYKNSIAYKNGVGQGFSIKKLLPNETSFSAQITFKDRGISISGFRTFHQIAFPNKNNKFFFYYGYGTHFRYYRRYVSRNVFTPFRPGIKHKGNYFAFGLDGITGIEYRFLKYPFVLASDINPNFEFGGATFFKLNLDMISVSIAYTF